MDQDDVMAVREAWTGAADLYAWAPGTGPFRPRLDDVRDLDGRTDDGRRSIADNIVLGYD
jgi:hypothetical protein